MKRVLHILLPLAAALSLFVNCDKERHYIHGNIPNLPDGEVWLRTRDMAAVDSARSEGGRFTIEVPDVLPDMLLLQFGQAPGFTLPVIVDGGSVSVGGNFNYPENITVSGSRANELFYAYRNEVDRYHIMIAAINLELDAYADSTAVADSARYETFYIKRDSIWSIVNGLRGAFIDAHPGSIVSAMFAAEALSDTLSAPLADSLLGRLDPAMPDNAFLRQIREKLK